MSVLGWILVGLGAWFVLAVGTALLLARLVRADRPSTLDVLRRDHDSGAGVPTPGDAPVAREPDDRGPDLPAPRGGLHDEAGWVADHPRRWRR